MRLAELTTLRVGGDAATVLAPETRDDLVATMLDVWASGDEWLVVGGGSNLLIGDDDFEGTVIRTVTRGIEQVPIADAGRESSAVRLRIQAGESWDELVAYTVEHRLAGIEALSGIPGTCGAAPIQNIGAYGQEIAASLVSIEFLDFLTGELERIPAAELGLDYRTSTLKQGREGVVISIDIDLEADASGLSSPVAYSQLAGALGVELSARVPLEQVRDSVLALRASKGMVLDANDPDSVSAGSFFTNPIVSENFARSLPAEAPRWLMAPEPVDVVVPLGQTPPVPTRPENASVKLSAAWLIERSGIHRGFALPGSRAAVSSKHTLALINRGGANADEISELARYIQTRVMAEFGVRLHPEPVLVGVQF
ncbi:MAG TPA: UDP-N-acetylmuramate dehydrogenase [Glaciihabitans sp.]|jgi:UDP-N-acetylmuramate dehydrogenase|nr:UDP-N-acetylmuramate dehydrogenase [Glaciihabitans sp.]